MFSILLKNNHAFPFTYYMVLYIHFIRSWIPVINFQSSVNYCADYFITSGFCLITLYLTQIDTLKSGFTKVLFHWESRQRTNNYEYTSNLP